jgi:hypothetical protein
MGEEILSHKAAGCVFGYFLGDSQENSYNDVPLKGGSSRKFLFDIEDVIQMC